MVIFIILKKNPSKMFGGFFFLLLQRTIKRTRINLNVSRIIPKNMIKISTINGAAKKAALGAMLAGSVAMFATNPIKTAKMDNPPQQTEVVSKDGADALRAITLPQQKQNPEVPTVHNKALDEKLKNFYSKDQKESVNNFLNTVYETNGSYLGSALVQQYIDLNMFLAFLDGNIDILKKFDEEAYNKIDKDAMQKVVEKSEPIKQWLNENYFKVYNQPFGQFDHPPDYEELNSALYNYIELDPYKLFENGSLLYKYDAKMATEHLKKSNMVNVQINSNLMATNIHSANEILFRNLLKTSGLCKESNSNDKAILENFKNFMYVVMPVQYY